MVFGSDCDGRPCPLPAPFHAFYASIPHQWFTNNDIADYEGFYASVCYSYFAGLGLDVVVEESTNRGRLDVLRHAGREFVCPAQPPGYRLSTG